MGTHTCPLLLHLPGGLGDTREEPMEDQAISPCWCPSGQQTFLAVGWSANEIAPEAITPNMESARAITGLCDGAHLEPKEDLGLPTFGTSAGHFPMQPMALGQEGTCLGGPIALC